MTAGQNSLLEAAVDRLIAMQGPDGLWGAFRMTPGTSRDWVGAVAGFALAEAAACGQLSSTKAALARDRADRAADALLAVVGLRETEGWGYNRDAGPDSDSTAAVVRLLTSLGRPVPAVHVAFLARHGTPDAGYATYLPHRDWDHWSRTTTEVDCAVAMALHGAGALTQSELCGMWQTRMAAKQAPDGTWAAYWWPGRGVPTLAAAELWQMAGRPAPAPRPISIDPGGVSAFDALHLAAAAKILGGGGDQRWLDGARIGPAEWPAGAVLLAPPRYGGPDRLTERSPEGQGVMTAAAAVRALARVRLPEVTRTALEIPTLDAAIRGLGSDAGLSPPVVEVLGGAVRKMLRGLFSAGLPWPNRPLSNLALGYPLEVSVGLGRTFRPAFRMTCDCGDARLGGADRARSAFGDLSAAAHHLGLGAAWATIARALQPVLDAAGAAAVDERFFLWAGLDLIDAVDGPRPVLKTYANLALDDRTAHGRAALAAACLRALDPRSRAAAQALVLADALDGMALCQQLALAALPDGRVGVKLYWELPAYNPSAVAQVRRALHLDPHAALSPVIPGLASLGDAMRGVSGLAVRIDPALGLMPDLTLATQAARNVNWHAAFEERALSDWARGMGFATDALRLVPALRRHGRAPRSLHTVTQTPRGLSAAVYFRPEDWTARALSIPFGETLCPDPHRIAALPPIDLIGAHHV